MIIIAIFNEIASFSFIIKKIGRNYFSIVQRDVGLQGFLYINKQGEKKGFYRQTRNTKLPKIINHL